MDDLLSLCQRLRAEGRGVTSIAYQLAKLGVVPNIEAGFSVVCDYERRGVLDQPSNAPSGLQAPAADRSDITTGAPDSAPETDRREDEHWDEMRWDARAEDAYQRGEGEQ